MPITWWKQSTFTDAQGSSSTDPEVQQQDQDNLTYTISAGNENQKVELGVFFDNLRYADTSQDIYPTLERNYFVVDGYSRLEVDNYP